MKKLKKFSKNENGKKKIIIGIYTFLIIGIILTGASYAVYQREAEVTFINATVGEFKENDIELAIKLDGEQVDTPPTKDNYTVTVDCDNATGEWDTNLWGATITNINANKVKCEVTFSTPKPTLSEVTVKPYTTSIELTYTAAGIGTTTACKYGTEENNYVNIVEGATNSKCSITGLEKGLTYYYQVCAVNGGGEECKIGSVKTHPLSEQVNIGDYITMTPTATSYTLPNELSGCKGTTSTCIQNEINPSELNLWRVIKKNEAGTVEMVSDRVSSETVRFYGRKGYINIVKGLNTIAEQYTDGIHVEGTRHIGYSNQTEVLINTDALYSSLKPWDHATYYSLNDPKCEEFKYLCGSEEPKGGGDLGAVHDYEILKQINNGDIRAQDSSGQLKGYFFSGRNYYGHVNSDDWYFQPLYTSSSSKDSTYGQPLFWGNNGVQQNIGASVRPVVILKSSTEIISGDGSEEQPYILS